MVRGRHSIFRKFLHVIATSILIGAAATMQARAYKNQEQQENLSATSHAKRFKEILNIGTRVTKTATTIKSKIKTTIAKASLKGATIALKSFKNTHLEGATIAAGKEITVYNTLAIPVYCAWFFDTKDAYIFGSDTTTEVLPGEAHQTIVAKKEKPGVSKGDEHILIVSLENNIVSESFPKHLLAKPLHKDHGCTIYQDANNTVFIIKSFAASSHKGRQAGLYQVIKRNNKPFSYEVTSVGSLITIANRATTGKSYVAVIYLIEDNGKSYEKACPPILIKPNQKEPIVLPKRSNLFKPRPRILMLFEESQKDLYTKSILSASDAQIAATTFKPYSFDDDWVNVVSINYNIVGGGQAPLELETKSPAESIWKGWVKANNPELEDFSKRLKDGDFDLPTEPNYRIRTGQAIGGEEQLYLEERKKIIKPALEQLGITKQSEEKKTTQNIPKTKTNTAKKGHKKNTTKNTPNEFIPTIALSFTGGGFRAMTETIGYLEGAKTIGLYDAATYMTGLSGSTWAISAFITSGYPINEFSNKCLKHNISNLKNLIPSEGNPVNSFRKMIFAKFRYNQEFGIVGHYGALVFNHLFGVNLKQGILTTGQVAWQDRNNITISDNPHWLKLSYLRQALNASMHPFPICTAISQEDDTHPEHWYEFTPFEIGTWDNGGAFVKTEYAGSWFDNGERKTLTPEQPLSYWMGIWGSAYAVDTDTTEIFAGARASGIVERFTGGSGKRLFPSKIPNFAYNIAHGPNADQQELRLIDGGHRRPFKANDRYSKILHNFATVPVLQRNVNVIIMGDSEQDLTGVDHLRATAKEASNLNLPFPTISDADYEKIQSIIADSSVVPCVCISDSKPNTPVIIYMKSNMYDEYKPVFKGQSRAGAVSGKQFDPKKFSAASTANFSYNDVEFELLSGLSNKIMVDSAPIIKHGIEVALSKKYNQQSLPETTTVVGLRDLSLH